MEDFQKWQELAKCNPGDKVRAGDKVYSFVRLKQKKFIGTDDQGQAWDILVTSFKEVVERVDPKAKEGEIATLKKGEPFYINQSGKALLFVFESIESGRIIGKNPVSNTRTRIDKSLYAGKVADI